MIKKPPLKISKNLKIRIIPLYLECLFYDWNYACSLTASAGNVCYAQYPLSFHATSNLMYSFWHNIQHSFGCLSQHICSKHVEAWNILIVKQKFCASSWLITEINILRCTVSKISKNSFGCFVLVRLVNVRVLYTFYFK